MERTLVLIKPDALERRLAGEVISRLERKGLKLIGLKMLSLTDKILSEHYVHLIDRPFFGEIAEFMKVTPIIASCWAGVDAVATVRLLCGITKSREATPGTIRGDLAMSVQTNIVHASDSVETAEQEIRRFFLPGEIFEFTDVLSPFIYSKSEQAGSV